MDNVGAEVGQKMRSAIKAKLLELNCYVDDELPDYIMVMVANRRSKSQMNEDLNLFLSTKTSAFVEWLHIVLKKLKEVTVTNPEVYKKVAKRKSNEQTDVKVKKEKLKKSGNVKKESQDESNDSVKSFNKNNEPDKNAGEFDIPLLSEINTSSENDLKYIEAKIRNVKSRLGIVVDGDVDEEILKIKIEKAKLEENTIREVQLQEEPYNSPDERDVELNEDISYTPEKPRRHSPITFEKEDFSKTPPRKNSILSRLGRRISFAGESEPKKKRLSSEFRKEEESNFKRTSSKKGDKQTSRDDRKYRRDRDRRRSSERKNSRNRKDSGSLEDSRSRGEKSVLSRLGVMSKIHVPEKPLDNQEIEDELKTREVRSMVQVKPRILPPVAVQPNKNLLLKAVAEANKSVSQANNKVSVKIPEGDDDENVPSTRKLSQSEKVKLRNLILAQVSLDDSDDSIDEKFMEYVPKPIRKLGVNELPEYVPSSRSSIDDTSDEKLPVKSRLSAKARLEGRKSPSPIVFKKISSKVTSKIDVPDLLQPIHPPPSVKTQERCKYWPGCRQGDKCEFVHPSTACEIFPNCNNGGEKCLKIHPNCKFGSSCSKRDCLYSHSAVKCLPVNKSPVVAQPQTCKFFPKCTNISCSFYHPKLCKFGKYCKNKKDCSFSHLNAPNKSSLTWRLK